MAKKTTYLGLRCTVPQNVLLLLLGYPGVNVGAVRHEQEPGEAPDNPQSPEHVENGGPAAEEVRVAEPTTDGQGDHRAELSPCKGPLIG